ncbi:MAG: CoA transferase [Proteobacteria bacterium]|nr:CoA transferase [Pseudomonadota bacterium]MDA1057074.1 CoA transferase [Pseudomonadota bacterium]
MTRALEGMKVVDLSRVLGGPYCTQMLADHGADVIKVEPPQGDETREWGPPFAHGLSAYFASLNRNKRSLALDLSKDEGRAVLMRMLESADIVIENFKVGTMERWGIGPDTLQQRFPKLIHARITGFGSEGPLGGMPGYDGAVQAWSGLLSVNGDPGTGPVRVGVSIVDMVTGLNTAIGILMAVEERHRSGTGQFLEVTLYDAALSILLPYPHNWFISDQPPKMMGNRSPNIAPYDLFPTAGHDLFLAVGNDRQFQRLCTELGQPEIADDPRFATNADRLDHQAELRAVLEGPLSAHDGEALAKRLMAVGIPAGAVLSVPDAMNHPHTAHRNMIVDAGRVRTIGTPIKFGRTPAGVPTEPPAFGAHSAVILAEFGFGPEEIETLRATGVTPETTRKLT